MADWFEKFTDVVGDVTDTVRGVAEAIESVTGQHSSDPMAIPATTASDTKRAQVSADSPPPASAQAIPVMPIIAVLAVLLLLK